MQSPAGNVLHPGASLPSLGRFPELELGLLRLIARPLCRLQIHVPLPLPRTRLPGLLRAPGPGLGTGTGAGHKRGERGAGIWGVRVSQRCAHERATSQAMPRSARR